MATTLTALTNDVGEATVLAENEISTATQLVLAVGGFNRERPRGLSWRQTDEGS